MYDVTSRRGVTSLACDQSVFIPGVLWFRSLAQSRAAQLGVTDLEPWETQMGVVRPLV